MIRAMRPVLSCLLGLLLIGCATLPVPMATTDDPEAAWARVLDRHVDDDGRVDFVALARNDRDLLTWVASIAARAPSNAPSAFPTPQSKLAFHLNAYNALAMYAVLQAGIPARLDLADRVEFFKLTRVVIGGMPISLYDYENDVIRKFGDARIHVALNCMVVSCPKLPRVPFRAITLNTQLEVAARAFFNDPRHIEVLPEQRELRVSAILDFYTEDFLTEAGSLVAYVNRYRTAQVPGDYRVSFIAYDWTINIQRRR